MKLKLTFAAALITLGCVSFGQAQVWQVTRNWSPQEEVSYSDWVAGLGEKSWASAQEALKSLHNPLREIKEEPRLKINAANLPVMLRSYYAYKRGLPFAYTAVDNGPNVKTPSRTVRVSDNLSYTGSLQQFFDELAITVHYGTYRTSPDAVASLTYPLSLSPKALRPCVMLFSQEGHIALIAEVENDGTVFLLEAHPDGSLSRIRFSGKLNYHSPHNVGGFRYFRPLVANAETSEVGFVLNNEKVPGYSTRQYRYGEHFYNVVRERLMTSKIEAVANYEQAIREGVYAELLDRADAVDRAWNHARKNPISVPANIYYASGDWNVYATPARDMRIRRAFLRLKNEEDRLVLYATRAPERLVNTWEPEDLRSALAKKRRELFDTLTVTYRNSTGKSVELTLGEVHDRVWRLSFDPNHPPERRWGGEGSELSGSPTNEARFHENFAAQQGWRYRVEMKDGQMGMDDPDNPANPPTTYPVRVFVPGSVSN
ncbi:MAG: hypothetical protein ACI8UO_005457 [Verrucomicrobiales bacterium]|jgi:hypothetical protein